MEDIPFKIPGKDLTLTFTEYGQSTQLPLTRPVTHAIFDIQQRLRRDKTGRIGDERFTVAPIEIDFEWQTQAQWITSQQAADVLMTLWLFTDRYGPRGFAVDVSEGWVHLSRIVVNISQDVA